jgi:hypothetical protein
VAKNEDIRKNILTILLSFGNFKETQFQLLRELPVPVLMRDATDTIYPAEQISSRCNLESDRIPGPDLETGQIIRPAGSLVNP